MSLCPAVQALSDSVSAGTQVFEIVIASRKWGPLVISTATHHHHTEHLTRADAIALAEIIPRIAYLISVIIKDCSIDNEMLQIIALPLAGKPYIQHIRFECLLLEDIPIVAAS